MVNSIIMSKLGITHMPFTEERRAVFLAGLRESGGSFSHACRVSSPHLDGESANPPSYTGWKALLANDPGFAAEFEETMQSVKDDIIRELHRRSVEGVAEPVFQKGERAVDFDGTPATVRKYSDSLLALRARAVLKGDYIDRKQVDVNVRVNSPGAMWTISAEDIACLDAGEKDQLKGIINKVRDHRRALAALPAPAAEQIEDADYAEVVD